MKNVVHCSSIICLFLLVSSTNAAGVYHGASIGNFSTLDHGLKGQVFAVNENTIFVKGFSYDGSPPAAFFWVGNGTTPNTGGEAIPFPANRTLRPLNRQYKNEDVVVHFPNGKNISMYDYIAVWCVDFKQNFGHVLVPKGFKYPSPVEIDGFATRSNGVKSIYVTIEDDRTVRVPTFSFDGKVDDAIFIAGKGIVPSMSGDYVQLSYGDGSMEPLRAYGKEVLWLKFPTERSIREFNWISVYSKHVDENLGHITLPLNPLVPPSLEGLNLAQEPDNVNSDFLFFTTFTNCIEPINRTMQVRWKTDKDGQHVIVQMMGKIKNEAGRDSEYMAFGLSRLSHKLHMTGADVVVGYYDAASSRLRVEDYFWSSDAHCDGAKEVCQDSLLGGANDAEILLDYSQVKDGVTIITYRRPVAAGDAKYDLPIPVGSKVAVVAAVGQLSSDNQATNHSTRKTDADDANSRISFSEENQDSCGLPLLGMGQEIPNEGPSAPVMPWINAISGVEEFHAKVGPTGGKRGYSAITGRTGRGIAWWINGLLVPEIYVERGKTYKFVVEGGDSKNNTARYHPLYITDSPDGGIGQLLKAVRPNRTFFAGIGYVDGKEVEPPTARGRFCQHKEPAGRQPDDFETFEDYQKALKVECQNGTAGELIWTVEEDTPEEVYYQCYIHKNMGWKIHVSDPGFVLERQGFGSGAKRLSSSVTWMSVVASSVAVMLLRHL